MKIITNKINFIDSLTSVRFFVALHVLYFHSGATFVKNNYPQFKFLNNFLENGSIGVPMFFLLSGYILTYVYSSRSFKITDYFVSRIARIFPVYYLSLVMLLPFYYHKMNKLSLPQLFLLQSWIPEYFIKLDNWNFVSWSLSVELALYILFPLFIKCLQNLSFKSLFCILLISICFDFLFSSDNIFCIYIPKPILYIPVFLYGIIFGLFFKMGYDLKINYKFSPDLIAVLIISLLFISEDTTVFPIITILFGLYIYLLSVNDKSISNYLLNNKLLMLCGASSYSLYVLQYSFGIWFNHFNQNQILFLKVIYSPLLVLISIIVFKYFEEPVREKLRTLFGLGRSLISSKFKIL